MLNKDYLGNVRVVIDDEQDAQLWQNNSYSAFGLLVTGTVTGISAESSAKANDRYYNGKEAQDVVGWYDFGARMYNPEIARWMNVDPLAEISRRWSPYNYTYNNPLRFIDPDGMSSRDMFGNTTFDGYVGDDGNGNFSGSVEGKGEEKDKDKGKNKKGNITKAAAGTAMLATAGIALESGGIGWSVGTLGSGGSATLGGLTLGTGGWALAGLGLIYLASKAPSIDADIAVPTVGTKTKNDDKVGVQYRLKAKENDYYPEYLHKKQGGNGWRIPTGLVKLQAGDTWKIGETIQWDGKKQYRYSQIALTALGVYFVPEFQGNQNAIKAKEGLELIKYLSQHNFSLPPGNLMLK